MPSSARATSARRGGVAAKPTGPTGGALLLLQVPRSAGDGGVLIDFRLVGWSFCDFSATLPLLSPLSDVKRLLVTKHGRMASLTLMLGSPEAERALPTDAAAEGATLRALGFGAAPSTSAAQPRATSAGRAPPQATQTLFYSFVPYDALNPTLLATYVRGQLGTNAGAF